MDKLEFSPVDGTCLHKSAISAATIFSNRQDFVPATFGSLFKLLRDKEPNTVILLLDWQRVSRTLATIFVRHNGKISAEAIPVDQGEDEHAF